MPNLSRMASWFHLGYKSEARNLQRILCSIPSLINTGRPDGYLDYLNQDFLQHLGLPMEELLGWNWTGAIHPEDVSAMVDRWRLSLARGEAFPT